MALDLPCSLCKVKTFNVARPTESVCILETVITSLNLKKGSRPSTILASHAVLDRSNCVPYLQLVVSPKNRREERGRRTGVGFEGHF